MRDAITLLVVVALALVALLSEDLRSIAIAIGLGGGFLLFLVDRIRKRPSRSSSGPPRELKRELGAVKTDTGSFVVSDAPDSSDAVRLNGLSPGLYEVWYWELEVDEATFILRVRLAGPGASEDREEQHEVHVETGYVMVIDSARQDFVGEGELDVPLGLGERAPGRPTVRMLGAREHVGLLAESGEGDGSYVVKLRASKKETILDVDFF